MGNNADKPVNHINNGFGFRVLKINPSSPTGKLNIEPFLDYIVSIVACETGETPSPLTPQSFFELLARQEGKETELGLFNIRSSHMRFIRVTPNKDWPDADGLLGMMIRFEDFSKAQEKTFRILKVWDNSPAYHCGLQAEEDYVLGFTHYNHKDFEDFINILRNLEKSEVNTVEMCVFNNIQNCPRFIYLSPDRQWGGEGSIGCEFGSGILNMLPKINYDFSHNEDLTLMSSASNPIVNNKVMENSLEKLGGMDGMNTMIGTLDLMSKPTASEENKAKAEEESSSDEDETGKPKQKRGQAQRKEVRADFVMPKPLTEQEILQQTGIYNMILNKRQQNQAGKKNTVGAIVPPKNPFSAASKQKIDGSRPGGHLGPEKGSGKPQGFEMEFQGKPRYEIQDDRHLDTKEQTEEQYEEGNIDVSDNNSFLNSLSNQFEEISMNHSVTQLETSNPPVQGISSQSQVPGASATPGQGASSNDNSRNQNGNSNDNNKPTNKGDTPVEAKLAARKDSRPKMTMRYSFFSQKLNGDYVISSEDLFPIDVGV